MVTYIQMADLRSVQTIKFLSLRYDAYHWSSSEEFWNPNVDVARTELSDLQDSSKATNPISNTGSITSTRPTLIMKISTIVSKAACPIENMSECSSIACIEELVTVPFAWIWFLWTVHTSCVHDINESHKLASTALSKFASPLDTLCL